MCELRRVHNQTCVIGEHIQTGTRRRTHPNRIARRRTEEGNN